MLIPNLGVTQADRDWQRHAACRGMAPRDGNSEADIFFPQAPPGRSDGPIMRAQLSKPKAVCADCPVTAQCRLYAKAFGTETGVWGGLWFGQLRNRRPEVA